MKPEVAWLVLTNTCAGSGTKDLGPKSFPYPFQPLAFMFKSTGRAKGGLYINELPCQNVQGDLEAMFGQDGSQVVVPDEVQQIFPKNTKFRLAVTDLSTSSNVIFLGILGQLYRGLDAVPPPGKGRIKWLNLVGTVTANAKLPLAGDLSFPFMPVGIGYKATDYRAKCNLLGDGKPFMNVAGALAAVFGTLGKHVPIPPDCLKKYPGGFTFEAETTDYSGSNNVVTISLFGVEYP